MKVFLNFLLVDGRIRTNKIWIRIQEAQKHTDPDPEHCINPSFRYRTRTITGLAFAVNGVELLHLNNVVTGCILLGGLFFYDIFWVFGTDVMVTVAKSFEAPIKLVFPQVTYSAVYHIFVTYGH